MGFLKRHKKALIITASVTAGVVAIGGVSLYLIKQKPIRAVFSSYNIINNGKNIDKNILFKKKDNVGNLIVVSHDYGHIDVLLMATELKQSKQNIENAFVAGCTDKTPILANIITSKKDKVKVLYINKKISMVSQMIDCLNNGNNVVVFLNHNNNGTGIYHTIKNTNCNVILSRVTYKNKNKYSVNTRDLNTKSFTQIITFYFKTMSKKYVLEYDTFEGPNELETPQEYMSKLKDTLYLQN